MAGLTMTHFMPRSIWSHRLLDGQKVKIIRLLDGQKVKIIYCLETIAALGLKVA